MSEEESVVEETTEVVEGEETIETLQSKYEEAEQKNKQLFARLKKEEEKRVELEGRIKTPSQTPETETKAPTTDDAWKREVEFTVKEGRSLESDELTEVITYAKARGIDYTEAMESPVIAAFLEKRKEEKRVKNATPSVNQRGKTFNGKTWSEMNDDERRKNYSKVMGK